LVHGKPKAGGAKALVVTGIGYLNVDDKSIWTTPGWGFRTREEPERVVVEFPVFVVQPPSSAGNERLGLLPLFSTAKACKERVRLGRCSQHFEVKADANGRILVRIDANSVAIPNSNVRFSKLSTPCLSLQSSSSGEVSTITKTTTTTSPKPIWIERMPLAFPISEVRALGNSVVSVHHTCRFANPSSPRFLVRDSAVVFLKQPNQNFEFLFAEVGNSGKLFCMGSIVHKADIVASGKALVSDFHVTGKGCIHASDGAIVELTRGPLAHVIPRISGNGQVDIE